MSLVRSLNVNGTRYEIQDKKSVQQLTAAERTILLSTGKYRGLDIASDTIFATEPGKFERFTRTVIQSTINWETKEIQNNTWSDITYGDGKWVAVAENSTYKVGYSTDNGNTWTLIPRGEDEGGYRAIAWCGDRFVVTDSNVAKLAYWTKDFVTYHAMTGDANNCDKILYNNGRVLFFRRGYAYTSYTDDFETLQQSGNISTRFYTPVSATINADGTIFAIASSDYLYKSTDNGKTWIEAANSFTCGAIAYGNNIYVAIHEDMNTNSYCTSIDGSTWTNRTFPTSGQRKKIIFANGKFYAVSNMAISVSTDGLNWTEYTEGITSTLDTLAGNNKQTVIMHNPNKVLIGKEVTEYTFALAPISYNKTEIDSALTAINLEIEAKQDELVSGTNIKTINEESLLGSGNIDIKTFASFPDDFVIDETFEAFVSSVINSPSATKGSAYLGGISGNWMPWGDGNAECKVEFMADGLALLTVSSSDIAPYHWEYNTYSDDYKWKNSIIQLSNLNNAYGYEGLIVQYTGETDDNYINGYFYRVADDTWQQVNIQPKLDLTTIPGYDATKTQILKHVNNSFVWVNDTTAYDEHSETLDM